MRKIKRLSDLVKGHLNDDNLHRIAISNLTDNERQITRWWCKKYRTPEKELQAHTTEELVLEMLEDYYESNPVEAERFMSSQKADAWDGSMPIEYEIGMRERFRKLKQVDLKQFKSERELTEKEENELIENLGRNLPKSSSTPKRDGSSPAALGDGEFDDTFGA